MSKTAELKAAREELKAIAAKMAEQTATEDEKERAKKLNDEVIPELQDAVDAIASDAETLKGIMATVNSGSDPDDEPKARNLGEHVKSAIGAQLRRGVKQDLVAPAFKAATDVVSTPSTIAGALTDYDTNLVLGKRRNLTIADLLGSETIQGNALTYYVEGAYEGTIGTTAEGAKKSQLSFGAPTAVTESLKKIAAFYKETDELLEDAQWLADSINDRLVYLVNVEEEDQLLNGDGTGSNLTGIMGRSGVQTATYAAGALADTILKAMADVRNASPFAADAIVINPTDYYTLRTSKDSNGQYFGGGYFSGAYGNGSVVEQLPIWGLRTVVTAAIPAGTVLVGAFAQGASVIRKGGLSVEVANTNEDDFISNRVTVRGEERIALAVRYPAAFVKLTAAID